MKFPAGRKAAYRFVIYMFGFSLMFLVGEAPLMGEVDYLAKMGVIRMDDVIDAPDFTLPDLDGRRRSLKDFRGRFVMLNFWATW